MYSPCVLHVPVWQAWSWATQISLQENIQLRTLVGWQPSAAAPSDLLQCSRQGLSWLLPPNNEAQQGTGAWIFLPIMKLSAGQSLLWAPTKPGQGFLGAALQFEVPSKQLSFLSNLFAQGPDLHWGLKDLPLLLLLPVPFSIHRTFCQ